MLFMKIITYEPDKREEVIKKRTKESASKLPPGVKVLGEWSALTGGRAFAIIEVENFRDLARVTAGWAHLCKFEIVPVMPTEELMEFLSSKK